jgi:C_GCAxxG_C_C family probable redox protein
MEKGEIKMAGELSREEFLNSVQKSAAACEREVHGCGRCALKSLIEHFGLGDDTSKDLMLKAILPLSGGIAQTRNTCAAALGGLMGIGMVYFDGKLEEATTEDLFVAMALGRKYYRSFEKEIGHIRCFDIREVGLGRCFDTSDPSEYEKFVAAGAYDLCSSVAGRAARIAAEYILDIQEGKKKR